MILRSLFVILLLMWSGMANAATANGYADVTWANLARTLVRFSAIPLSDQTLLDEYAVVTECKLYESFYKDDFKWERVRKAILESAQMNVATYPTSYHYDVPLELDRYDFTSRTFLFAQKSKLSTINTFVLYSVVGTNCGNAEVKSIPRIYRAVLSSSISLDGLPLAASDAEAVLKRMEAVGNTSRFVYARFNLRIVYIAPLSKMVSTGNSTKTVTYAQMQTEAHERDSLRMDAQLDSAEFYEDREMTRLLYQYTP